MVVPDELSLTIWDRDPVTAGLLPVWELAGAEVLHVADPLPPALEDAVARLRRGLADDVDVVAAPRDGHPGEPPADHAPAHQADGHADHQDGGHSHDHGGQHHDHGGHGDHHDMMAIVGEPSADGLVMEPIRFSHGPLAPGLPGGLVAEVELDGDVVAASEIHRTLAYDRAEGDPLAPAAAAMARMEGERTWHAVVAVELERALSHAAWLRAYARLLGWDALAADAQGVVQPVLRGRAALAENGEAAAPTRAALDAARRLRSRLTGSRRLRARLEGRGRVATPDGLQGPNLRASGVAEDARSADPAYGRLGFRPVVETGGDSLARTRVRLSELTQSLELALGGLAAAGAPPAWTGPVEGPRGPVGHAGDDAAVAAAASIGSEWAAALAIVASFDPSPWRPAA